MVEAIGKYRYFLTHADKIERLFAEFDKNHNSILEKAELKKAMQAIEDREHSVKVMRGVVFGMETRVRVTDEDVDYIMELCDESGDGGIDRAEALAGVGAVVRCWPTSTSSSRQSAPAPSRSMSQSFKEQDEGFVVI